ncbi:Integrin alpha ina-1 [Schistosoma japonicum]|nr:Integrin alpha ina-1 [Schistosoma japonicum]
MKIRTIIYHSVFLTLVLIHGFGDNIKLANGFNIDIKSPLLKTGKDNCSFGFSLLGYTHFSGQKGVIIGSPTDGDNGGLFWCPLLKSTCSRIDINLEKETHMQPGLKGALLGYSMSSAFTNSQGPITVCAPRLSWSSASSVYLPGGCFELNERLEQPQLNPAPTAICLNVEGSDKSIDLRYCTFGASVSQHPNKPKQLFMGGPHYYFEKGVGASVNMNTFERVITSIDGIPSNTLLGSSVDTTDRLYAPLPGLNSYELYVAYGGPGVPSNTVNGGFYDNIKFGNGIVVIFQSNKQNGRNNIKPLMRIEGRSFGSRFGHSLLFIDINGDNWDDLIIGAPFQYSNATDGGYRRHGAVYIFLNRQSFLYAPVDEVSGVDLFSYDYPETFQMITPPSHNCGNSRIPGFGAAITKLGDINHDGYQDFAIGAPYEDNGGAVYIYHGCKSGKIQEPTQVICGTDLQSPRPLEGFGFSLGLNGADLDENGYPDMAIGATLSSSVAVLRARPVVKLNAYLTLMDGSTSLPSSLNSLMDCTNEAQSITGYKSLSAKCVDLKLILTYTSVDGKPCNQRKMYPVSVLLKYNPTTEWISEGWEQNLQNNLLNYESKCTSQHSNLISKNIMNEFYKNYTLSPIVFMREKGLSDSETIVKDYFKRNESAYLSGFDSPGGYLQLEGNAFCRDLHKVQENAPFNHDELNLASTLRLIFRDTYLIDQTDRLKIGAKWIAKMTEPYPLADQIDEYPVTDPRENTELLQLSFDNPCAVRQCCPSIRVSYSVKITRDKTGPVVYVGDDNNQTIEISVRVTNIGDDLAYVNGLVSNFPPNLLELDSTLKEASLIQPNTAICHLKYPLAFGESSECIIRWLVVGHQLTVQMAKFHINSTLLISSNSPIHVEGQLTNELRVNIKMIVNVSIFGTVDPNTIYFSGNVSDGISSMTAENQIGDVRIVGKFTVRNLRKHSLIPASRLIIDWPFEFAGLINEPRGKYLLYLLENPYVIQHTLQIPGQTEDNTSTSVVCDSKALGKVVNPHNYRVFSRLRKSNDGVPVRTAPIDVPLEYTSSYPPLSNKMILEPVPDRLTDSNKLVDRKMTTISCYNGRIRCIPIICDLGRLSYKAGPITLEFIARLWDNTMREEFLKVFLTKLHLTATWRADVKYGIDLGGSDYAQDTIEVHIFNNLEPKPIPPKYMALYIGLAVFGGLLLLSILVIILYKAGFFKRKRFMRRRTKAHSTDATQRLGQYTSAEPKQRQPPVVSPGQSSYYDNRKTNSGRTNYHQVPNTQVPVHRRTPYSPSSDFSISHK